MCLCFVCKANESVTIYTEIFPPYQVQASEGGKITGLTTYIVKSIFDEIGINYSIQVLPWPRAYKMVENTENAFIYSMIRTPLRKDKFHWLFPLCQLNINIYKKKSRSDIQIESPSDLKKYIIGIARDNAIQEYLIRKEIKKKKNLVMVNTINQLSALLLKERTDLIIISGARFNVMRRNYPDEVKNIEKIYTLNELKRQLYLAANIATQASLINQVKATYQQADDKVKSYCDRQLEEYEDQRAIAHHPNDFTLQ